MSEVLDREEEDGGSAYDVTWPTGELNGVELHKHYAEVEAYRDAMKRANRGNRRLGLWIGASGYAVALVFAGLAVFTIYRKPMAPPPGFIEIDRSTGYVGLAMPAKDAPDHFSDRTAERSINGYIIACMSYVPQTYARDFEECAAMSAPEQQQRLQVQASNKNPSAPVNVYGAKGYAMPVGLKFIKKPDGKFRTYRYEVDFDLDEIIHGERSRKHYVSYIDFQWHPELPMSNDVRLFNEAGLQVISFHADAE